jgi:hypothetical protein
MPIAIEGFIDVSVPDSKMRMGMNTKSIIWGLIDYIIYDDFPSTPSESRQYPRQIPNTKSIGV